MNKRIQELKLALYINHIDKSKDKLTYGTLMRILSCLAASLGKEAHIDFTRLVQNTIGDSLLKATDKELIACVKRNFSNRKAATKLGIVENTFYRRYNDLLNRNYDTEEYINSLQPMFNSASGLIMIDTLIKFIENFKFKVGNEEHKLLEINKTLERTLELEFVIIYDKLMNILQNSSVCDKFIFNICNLFDIDFSTISQLKNNVHVLNRTYPKYVYGNRYFMQELVTLYTYKGLSKGTIGSSVLNKDSAYLFNGTNKKYDVIPEDELDWQYTPTIEWNNLNKGSVLKFINIFHSFIKYDV